MRTTPSRDDGGAADVDRGGAKRDVHASMRVVDGPPVAAAVAAASVIGAVLVGVIPAVT
jgi:hypothetical protein